MRAIQSAYGDTGARINDTVVRFRRTMAAQGRPARCRAAVADAFCASRVAGKGGLAYGTLTAGVDAAVLVERHTPAP